MHWWLPENISTYGGRIDDLFYLILYITGVIFIAVEVILVVFLIKYRGRANQKAMYTHGNKTLEIIWTIVPAILLIFMALKSQTLWSEIKNKSHIPPNAIPIEIFAEQFAWNIRYPGPDGHFGTIHTELISKDNPFGLDTTNDVAAKDDIITQDQLHIPVGQPVHVRLSSKDVIHSFFVPVFRLKQDAVPGMWIDLWFEATKTTQQMREEVKTQIRQQYANDPNKLEEELQKVDNLNYEIACAELCGLGHYRMRGYITIHTPEEFQNWLKTAKEVAESQ